MSNFSFNYTQGNNAVKPNTNTNVMPSQSMKELYIKMCAERRVTPKDISNLTRQELQTLMDELKQFIPASDGQIKTIVNTWKELYDAKHPKVKRELPPKAFIQKLTGGRNGTASSFIQQLFDMRNEISNNIRPTDNQIKIMVEWYLCPDIPFEDFDIQKKVPLKKEVEEEIIVGAEGERTVGAWTYKAMITETRTTTVTDENQYKTLSPMEFAEQIKEKMSKADASMFIDKYKHLFYEWRKTRITQAQINHIRTLEKRLGNTQAPPQLIFNEDGEPEMRHVYTDSRDQMNQEEAYKPLDEIELLQFSAEDASKYIEQLNWEVNNYELYKFGNIYNDHQQAFEETRTAKNINDANVKEFTELNDLMYKLQAVSGMDIEEYQNDAMNIFFEGGSDQEKKKLMKNIHAYMMKLLDDNMITYSNLLDMVDKSETAQAIMLGRI